MHEYTLTPIGDAVAPAVWGEIVTLLAVRSGACRAGELCRSRRPRYPHELSDGATVVGVQGGRS